MRKCIIIIYTCTAKHYTGVVLHPWTNTTSLTCKVFIRTTWCYTFNFKYPKNLKYTAVKIPVMLSGLLVKHLWSYTSETFCYSRWYPQISFFPSLFIHYWKTLSTRLACSTTVTVPGAMATTEATVSGFSVPSSIICWRMLTDAGSSLSVAVVETTPTKQKWRQLHIWLNISQSHLYGPLHTVLCVKAKVLQHWDSSLCSLHVLCLSNLKILCVWFLCWFYYLNKQKRQGLWWCSHS